jgi:ABC-2 type transport system ATP-binding protein
MAAIEIDGLGKRYGDKDALIDVTLAVEEGHILGLLGPNGAGKTTLIRVLLGLAFATEGSGHLLGSSLPPDQKALAQTGAMVEEPAFYPWMTAREHLRVHALTAGSHARRPEIVALLERVGLADAATQKVGRFSQGMRQRLGLARALLREPRLLVLDEPANGLDPPGIIWLRGLLRDLAGRGVTILVSSHQLGEIERVCDDVVILNAGRVAETFRMSDVDDENRVVKITVDPKLHETAAVVLAASGAVAVQPGVFHVTDHDSAGLVRLLGEHAIYPSSVEREQPSLERRFLETIGIAP